MEEKELEQELKAKSEDLSETNEAAEQPEPEAGACMPETEEAERHEKRSRKERREKKDKKDEEIAELKDRVKRQLAEFENFRNRSEKEKAGMYEMGARSVIEKMLPVIDNFERGLAAIPEGEVESPVATGMQMIYKQMMTEFENMGVKPIEAIGKEFDPDFHNAVMQTESDIYESGVVAQELQKGYLYHDSVVRHSMVGVVQ